MIYVLQVQTGKELTVCHRLKNKNIDAFSPRRELIIHKNGLWTKVINTLFKGYVFIICDYSAKLHHAVVTDDDVIKFLGSPTPLPKHEETFMNMLINNGKIIEQSIALVDENGLVSGYEGFLKDKEDMIVYVNKRQLKVAVEVRFGGKAHRANLGIELKRADDTRSK